MTKARFIFRGLDTIETWEQLRDFWFKHGDRLIQQPGMPDPRVEGGRDEAFWKKLFWEGKERDTNPYTAGKSAAAPRKGGPSHVAAANPRAENQLLRKRLDFWMREAAVFENRRKQLQDQYVAAVMSKAKE